MSRTTGERPDMWDWMEAQLGWAYRFPFKATEFDKQWKLAAWLLSFALRLPVLLVMFVFWAMVVIAVLFVPGVVETYRGMRSITRREWRRITKNLGKDNGRKSSGDE